jgi:hypothetical protein
MASGLTFEPRVPELISSKAIQCTATNLTFRTVYIQDWFYQLGLPHILLLISWTKVIPEKIKVCQTSNKFPAFWKPQDSQMFFQNITPTTA